MLPALHAKRATVQGRRRRADRDIVGLFGEPFRPSFFGRSYWRAQQEVVRRFEIARMFGEEEAMGAPPGLEDFVAELQGRIEELERALASAREHAAATGAAHAIELGRLGAEVERLRSELGSRSAVPQVSPEGTSKGGALGGLWRLVRGR